MSLPPDSATPPEAASWLARGQSLEAQATPESLAEAVRSYELAIAVLRAQSPATPALRRDLAVAHMNRGNALQKISSADSLAAAVLAYDDAIALLASPDFAAQPAAQNTLGAAWMNRGHALHRQATPEAITATVDSHRHAIAILQTLPLQPSETTPPEAAINHRFNLAGSWMNLANALLDSASLPKRYTDARDATSQALAIVELDDLVHQHPAAAELSLLSRRARCDALGHLIYAVSDPALSHDLATEAGDMVDDGLALVRHWEQREIPHFRPLAARLYHFGAQLYRINQPHFLAEFLLEHLDPERSPGATPTDPVLYSIADDAIAQAQRALQSSNFFDATNPAAARQLETSRDLKAAAARVAELRQQHLPPVTA